MQTLCNLHPCASIHRSKNRESLIFSEKPRKRTNEMLLRVSSERKDHPNCRSILQRLKKRKTRHPNKKKNPSIRKHRTFPRSEGIDNPLSTFSKEMLSRRNPLGAEIARRSKTPVPVHPRLPLLPFLPLSRRENIFCFYCAPVPRERERVPVKEGGKRREKGGGSGEGGPRSWADAQNSAAVPFVPAMPRLFPFCHG